jgi:hypothetical protein
MALHVRFVLFPISKIMKTYFLILIAILSFSTVVLAQRPPSGGGGRPPEASPNRQPRFPPRPGENRRDDDDNRNQGQPPVWIKTIDTNKNQKIERDEFDFAANLFFQKRDKNGNGIFEKAEHPEMQRGGFPFDEVPPFLFLRIDQFNLTRAEFDLAIDKKFKSLDYNHDGWIDREEIKNSRPENGFGKDMRNAPPNATFIGAEMRFGDKFVKDSPFSAETIMENTRRLFDGSTVTKLNRGRFYRDSAGRTRREQPLDFIGSFGVVGENNQAQTLIFISDFVEGNQYFLDSSQKIARKHKIENNRLPNEDIKTRGGKTESLGIKMLEGVSVEGTRITFEIPVGEIGNDKPILVVTEKWYSAELQTVVMSKHIDPIAGEQTFRLVNITRVEPPTEMFQIPTGFRIENPPKREKRDD